MKTNRAGKSETLNPENTELLKKVNHLESLRLKGLGQSKKAGGGYKEQHLKEDNAMASLQRAWRKYQQQVTTVVAISISQ